MAIEYGTIAVVPMGEWDSDSQYEVANLVTRDGSSFLAHTRPPVGTLPTNTAYWQVSAQGTSKATADSVGTVKPDGVTTEVSADGSLSVKTAAQDALGLVKGSAGISVGPDGAIDVNTIFEQATELANIMAGEAISQVLGKISKSIAVTMGLDQNALLKNMLTNIDANDQNKIPTSAFIHTLYNRIGMGTELTAGANLTEAANTLNSDLSALTKPIVLTNAASINLDSGLFGENKIYYHVVSSETPQNTKGLPSSAYGYGALITGKHSNAWLSFQIYIPHNNTTNTMLPIYFRTFADTTANNSPIWRYIEPKMVQTNA
jgi:hypothetical protein